VGAPIVVEGRLWGVIIASFTAKDAAPPDVEARLKDFTELVASAIANADRRAELLASRARVVAAADEARRRLVRDLHDGAQQRLVHTVVTLKLARLALRDDDGKADAALAAALEQAETANTELRELAHGLHPAVLARGGLGGGIDALVSRLTVPVTVDVSVPRMPPAIEANAYFIIAEALTNVVKHAGAHAASVRAWIADGAVQLEVADDGVGGADAGGTGLLGLADRVAAFGGRLRIDSPQGGGTLLGATLALPDAVDDEVEEHRTVG
jgi:signal transduction histidine kinase